MSLLESTKMFNPSAFLRAALLSVGLTIAGTNAEAFTEAQNRLMEGFIVTPKKDREGNEVIIITAENKKGCITLQQCKEFCQKNYRSPQLIFTCYKNCEIGDTRRPICKTEIRGNQLILTLGDPVKSD